MISALFALLHAALRQPFTSSRALHAAIHEHLRAVNTIDGLHHPSLAWINLDPLKLDFFPFQGPRTPLNRVSQR